MKFDKEMQIIVLLIGICAILFFIQTVLVDMLYTQTPDYLLKDQEVKTLKVENLELRNQLLHLSAYTTIASEAAKMGFEHSATLVPL